MKIKPIDISLAKSPKKSTPEVSINEKKLLEDFNAAFNSTPLERHNNLVKYIKQEIKTFKNKLISVWDNLNNNVNTPENEKKLSDNLMWLLQNNNNL